MNTLRHRTLPLLLSIAVGTVVSWVSIYAFIFSVWVFHSITAVRASEAVAEGLLLPAHWVFRLVGVDQTAIFFDPLVYSGTNGLILGVILYSCYRGIFHGRPRRPGGAG